ncbi:MAG: aldose 1-epimerase family protein [Burkholderiales bacterium]|nr:aldose 1-epimerase family protein [Burkholderiales bacterium]
MSQIIISNEILEVTINLKGAEVRSVRNKSTSHEYMWHGDPSIWAGVSPTLFPVVGKTSNGEIRFDGKSYQQGNHGFARNSTFNISAESKNSVTLSIITNELGDVYPFNLQFDVIYSLLGKALTTMYKVYNLDNKEAYFSVGAHPAFKCPFDDKHDITDYIIEFENHENNLIQHKITNEAFFTGETSHNSLQHIELNNNSFIEDAIIYSNFNSQYILLKEKVSNKAIKVSLKGFPWLGLWSKVGAKYICIEPWCGHSDSLNFDGNIDQKEAIEKLNANSVWQRDYIIEFNY